MNKSIQIFVIAISLIFISEPGVAESYQAQFSDSDQTLLAQSSKRKSKRKSKKKKKKKSGKKKKKSSSMDDDGMGDMDGMDDDESGDGSMSAETTAGSSSTSSSYSSKGPKGMAFGAGGGWEAIYGNGVSFHFFPSASLDFHGGLGYNTSGLKIGAGGGMNIFLASAFALRFGAVLTHSVGNDGTVSLTAKFTPEDSANAEDIEATKGYKIGSSQALGIYGGGLIKMTDSLYLNALGNFNVIVAGNDVTLDEDIEYDKSVQITNTDSFDPEFNTKAAKQAAAGGLGFSVGILMFL